MTISQEALQLMNGFCFNFSSAARHHSAVRLECSRLEAPQHLPSIAAPPHPPSMLPCCCLRANWCPFGSSSPRPSRPPSRFALPTSP